MNCFAAFTLVLLSYVAAQAQPASEDRWKPVAACGWTFEIPVNAKKLTHWGVDSCVRQYQTDTMYVSLDVTIGSTPNDLTAFRSDGVGKPNRHLNETVVDGAAGFLLVYDDADPAEIPSEASQFRYVASLFVPHFGKHRQGMWLRTYGKTAADQATAKRIFQSLKISTKLTPRRTNRWTGAASACFPFARLECLVH